MATKIRGNLGLQRSPILLVLLALSLIIPIFGRDPYLLHIFILIYFYISYCYSWNILAYSGQVSFGHAAFLGIGGYTATILAINMFPPAAGIFIGAAAAAVIGLLIGLTCVRLREWFLALVTFGFAIILEAVVIELDWLTGGTFGLAVPQLFPAVEHYYYGMLALALLTMFVMYIIMKSKTGLAFSAIRENEDEARASGVNVVRYKLFAFTISTFLTGLAGALNIHFIGFINPQIFGLEHSFWPIIMVMSGGIGTLGGPIVGAVLIQFIWEALRIIDPSLRMIVIGLILIIVIIFMPKGISPVITKYVRRVTARGIPQDAVKSRKPAAVK